jgi:hypothetical protein
MKNQITYLFALLLFLLFSNIYSQTDRIDGLFEKHINRQLHSKHKEKTDDFLNNTKFENQIFRTSQKQDFDSSSVVDSIITMRLNGEKFWKYVYTYDSIGNITSELRVDIKWGYHYRYTYTYDASGNQTSKLQEDWDGSQWVNYSRYTYTYDASRNLTSELYESWDGSQWVNSYRITYTYDSNENMTSII